MEIYRSSKRRNKSQHLLPKSVCTNFTLLDWIQERDINFNTVIFFCRLGCRVTVLSYRVHHRLAFSFSAQCQPVCSVLSAQHVILNETALFETVRRQSCAVCRGCVYCINLRHTLAYSNTQCESPKNKISKITQCMSGFRGHSTTAQPAKQNTPNKM